MALGRITVRERIDPAITASLFSNYRNSADAVLELVDNAVDSRLAGAPLAVEITVRPTSLIVFTSGGEGMGLQDLERNYLRWGGSPKRGRQLLGQYGQGGKAAIGHLGQRFSVEASRPGEPLAWRFTDDDYRDRSRLKTYEVVEVAKRTPVGTGSVRIRVDGVDKRIDLRRLGQRLAESYRPLLEPGLLVIRLNGAIVQPVPLAVVDRHPVSVNASGRRLQGWFGLADPDRATPGWAPGLRCYRLGRLIADGEFFGHPGPAHVPAMARLMGEIDIPQVPLTMNKGDFDRDSRQWVEVEERMHRTLEAVARRLRKEGDAPPPASAVRVAEQVRRLLGQALRMAERQDIFSGFAAVSAETKPRPPAPDELPLEEASGPAPEPRRPAVAAGGARPAGGARRGFGAIVIRALAPSIRSTTVLEEGARIVVINSRYPLYEERRGDMWYQLETAAREVCRAADGASVTEYEQRVNEIVLTASALRGRRRRTARSRASQFALLKDL